MVVVLWDDFHEEMNNNNTATNTTTGREPQKGRAGRDDR